MSGNRKKNTPHGRELEIEGAKIFGQHVSKEKGLLLLAVTLLACAAPMLLGARLWGEIPEMVESGLIGMDGRDDSIPRWMVAFGLPGLMCILNLIAHGQLLYNQSKMTLPPVQVRFFGRWGFPVLSLIFCTGMILRSTGRPPLAPVYLANELFSLLLLICGAKLFDARKGSGFSFRFSFTESDGGHKAFHRFAGCCWMAAGLAVAACVMLDMHSFAPLFGLAALVIPIIYGFARPGQKADKW